VVGVIAQYVEQGGDNRRKLEHTVRPDDIPRLQPYFPVAHHRPRLCAFDRFAQTISMDELTTSIVGIDFSNEDKSKSNRRMECMLCAPGEAVELRLEPTNPYDENAVAIFSERGTQLGYVSAERAPLIGKRMKEGEAIAVFQAMHGSGAYIRIRFGGGVPTLPDPVPDVPKRPPPRQARPAQRPIHDPHEFYPDEEGPEWGA